MFEEGIRNLLELRLKKLGYHIIRVKIINNNKKKILQIMAERIKDRLMDIDDCVFLSRQISLLLEVEDPISSSYTLEVSSGGLDRPLTTKDDYKWFEGNKAIIKLKNDFMGKKTFSGFLRGLNNDGLVLLETGQSEIMLNLSDIKKANLDPNWVIDQKKQIKKYGKTKWN